MNTSYKHVPRKAYYRLVAEVATTIVAIGTLYRIFNSALTGNIDMRAGQDSKLTQIAKAGN